MRVLILLFITSILFTNHGSVSARVVANERLETAIRSGNVILVKQLIEQGLDIDTQDGNGFTPLGTAAMSGQLEVATLLIKSGANPNAGKYPPLACASGINKVDQTNIINLLIENGADVNKARYDGLTPLHLAVMHGHTNVVKLLLSKGAEINTVNPEGHTVLDWAILLKRSDVQELLKSQGGTEGCGPALGKKTVTNDFTAFSLYVFPPAVLLIFLASTYVKQRNSWTLSPIVLSYSIPIIVFAALQIPHFCSSTAQRVLFHAVLAIGSITLQILAVFLKKPSLIRYSRALAIFGLVLLTPFYLFVLIMFFFGNGS